MHRVDGTFGLNFLLAVLRNLEDCKRHCGVCPDGTENKCLTKAHGCLPVGWLMGPVSSQQLSLGPGASSAPLCSVTGGTAAMGATGTTFLVLSHPTIFLRAFVVLKLITKQKTAVREHNATHMFRFCSFNSFPFCLPPKEQDLEPMKEDFFSKLEYLLRFLNHNTLPKETA